ncbi:EthD domain-containing protein [Mycena galopus ATCC 62051]|nr:EthD domain-containing protein [Mycena galopus ATCC 62051]
MSYRADRVRFALLVNRKPGLSKEEFHKYWSEKHGPLVTTLDIVKQNLLKYEQGHTNYPVLEQMAQMTGAPIPEWDGMAIFEAESYAKFFEIVQSEEYQKILVPDEDLFIDRHTLQMIPLDLMTVLEK